MNKLLITVLFISLFFLSLGLAKTDKDENNKAGIISFVSISPVQSPSVSVPFLYLSKIKKFAAKHNLREDLVIAVAKAESNFDQYAQSHKGAVGIMQLMKDTAKQYGISNRYNADENIEAGIKHLKYLYTKYKQNLPLTLAAYNAGEDAVKKYGDIPPFKETRNYIRKVMQYMGQSFSFYSRPRNVIYKYWTEDGKIVITDSLPSNVTGKVEIIN